MNASPLLIVNADDLGRTRLATDAIIECYRSKGITSASVMVWMADSRRAAELGRATGVPLGLHLNFTEPFTDPDTPPSVRARQAMLFPHFTTVRRWGFNPLLHHAVELAVQDQLRAFQTLVGREPSHADGHHHVHFTPNVLLARTLPRAMKLRRTYTFRRDEKSVANRMFRQTMHLVLVRRHRTTRYFFDLRQLHPELGGRNLDEALELARRVAVEVMCHPELDDERQVLRSRHWLARLAALPTGSYAML